VIGHTLGLNHASENGAEYSDMTGQMSSSYIDANWPRKCFNGANQYHLGWFADRQVKWSGESIIKLATFVDYDSAADDEKVIVNIADQYYLQYNRKKGMNENTEENDDKVTIHKTINNGEIGQGTEFLDALGVGEMYHLSDPNLFIKVCEAYTSNADVMLLSFASESFGLCQAVASEQEPTDPPIDLPTEAPTDPPTDEPTPEPTDKPTEPPTDEPTEPPTDEPTPAPTEAPTDLPVSTKALTDLPAPTESPTHLPVTTNVPTFPIGDRFDTDTPEEDTLPPAVVTWQGDEETPPPVVLTFTLTPSGAPRTSEETSPYNPATEPPRPSDQAFTLLDFVRRFISWLYHFLFGRTK